MRLRSPFSLFLSLTLVCSPYIDAQLTPFQSNAPTCVNSSATLSSVTVQPYCDNPISTICSTVVADIAAAKPLTNYKAVGVPPYAIGACEVTILFFQPWPAPYLTYESCVESFESITIDCMLIGIGKYAGKGHQAGVRGVVFDRSGVDGSASHPQFAALGADSPGFIVGPPFAYGNITATDLTDKVLGNSPDIPA
ncbi:MAG: hypothetical protein Q9170_001327 [Blastenia crenularia]